MERGMIDDGACWLDKRLTFSGRSDIDLSLSFFHDVLDNAAKSHSQVLPTLKTNMLPAKTLSKAVPKASDWESW
ncbi:hypothetical protein PAXRUDRAFT_835946 [Paxillus rubicundulus Ve08.2h10]|uniref:Uncharacterized protein n=1 Tax=Paxillus rubicundulus Ve08.2h10 TaxID=930991 RepID=A0A0D0BT24_9AGAM|nr:hypothetical protein PAXRUDRAFT_835946 [Paxillus rubicundulus Ve08.2h10]